MKLTKEGKRVCPVIDIHANAPASRHSYEEIGKELDLCVQMGFDRVYTVIIPDGCPMISSPWMHPAAPHRLTGNALIETAMAVGDTAFAYAYEARKRGLEIFAIYKPYEGGGGMSIPHGAETAYGYGRREDIGGDRIGFETFVADHPEFITRRFPEKDYTALLNQGTTSLQITFVLDEIIQPGPLRNTGHLVQQRVPKGYLPAENPLEIRLFVSRDNGDYIPWPAAGVKNDFLLSTDVSDANGRVIMPNALCRRVDIKNLYIPPEYRYIAFTIEGENRPTLPYSMVKLFGDKGELPVTVSEHVRTRGSLDDLDVPLAAGRVWGAEDMPKPCLGTAQQAEEAFLHNGFEFGWHGQGFTGDGFRTCRAYGIARGKIQLMKGNLCEGYEEVRAHWLANIDRLLEKGFHGVDIRLQAHSSMIYDYASFGANSPLVARYEELYGKLAPFEKPDVLNMMRVRGSYYCDFVEEAARLIHAKGKKLSVHVRHCFEDPVNDANFNELGFWVMPKILPDYKRLIDAADEVVIKDYFFNNYRPEVAAKMKAYAKARGKRVFMNLYISQCGEMNKAFWQAVCADESIGGICLYEVGNPDSNSGHDLLHVPDPGLISLRNGIRLCQPAAGKLQSLLAESEFR